MIRTILLALALTTASAAYATPGGEGNNTNCNGVGNANSPCNPSNPIVGDTNNNKVKIDFDATVVNENTFKPVNHVYAGGGDATSKSYADSNSTSKSYSDSNSDSKAYATGGNATGGSVGNVTSESSASVGDTSLSNDNTNNSNNSSQNNVNVTYSNQQSRIPVSTAYAAPLTASIDTCLGSMTAGGQTQLFGLSIGGTKRDKNCELIKLAREAGQMGMADVQCQLLSTDERFAEALERAGRTCELPRQVQVIEVPVPVVEEEFDITTVRSLPPLDGPYDGERG